jgi:hypothetical protein
MKSPGGTSVLPRCQRRPIQQRGVAALRLDRVHGHVGVAHQVGHRVAVAREHRDADARGHETLLAAHEDGFAHHVEDAVGHSFGISLVGDLRQQRHEFVATQPAHGFERAVRPRTHGLDGAFHHLVGVTHA